MISFLTNHFLNSLLKQIKFEDRGSAVLVNFFGEFNEVEKNWDNSSPSVYVCFSIVTFAFLEGT